MLYVTNSSLEFSIWPNYHFSQEAIICTINTCQDAYKVHSSVVPFIAMCASTCNFMPPLLTITLDFITNSGVYNFT